MNIRQKYKSFLPLLLAVLLFNFASCDSATKDSPYTATLSAETISSNNHTIKLDMVGVVGTNWQAEVIEGGNWCDFSLSDNLLAKEGTFFEGVNTTFLYCSANTGKTREAHIQVYFEQGYSAKLTLTQNDSSVPEVKIDCFEVPTRTNNSNYIYTSHFTEVGGKEVRNFSLCLDKSAKAAAWVAYPLHKIYLNGSGHRTNTWSFDPTISTAYQAHNTGEWSYKGDYDRGHQLPSADRLGTEEMNFQTFYMTNVAPQASGLNQQMWVDLESAVRSNTCTDTLYVVTGAVFGSATTKDSEGNTVKLPSHFFKVLLRTVDGTTGKSLDECAESEIKSIGFWVEHRNIPKGTDLSQFTMSVAEIEKKTGFEFFPRVPEGVKEQHSPKQWKLN